MKSIVPIGFLRLFMQPEAGKHKSYAQILGGYGKTAPASSRREGREGEACFSMGSDKLA